MISQNLGIEIEGYIYQKSFSLDEAWALMEEISKGYVLKVYPINFNIEKLDIAIKIVEILEKDLKIETNSIKLRVQKSLSLENKKLKQLSDRCYYTLFKEKDKRILILYFLNSNSKKIKKDEEKEYIEVYKQLDMEL